MSHFRLVDVESESMTRTRPEVVRVQLMVGLLSEPFRNDPPKPSRFSGFGFLSSGKDLNGLKKREILRIWPFLVLEKSLEQAKQDCGPKICYGEILSGILQFTINLSGISTDCQEFISGSAAPFQFLRETRQDASLLMKERTLNTSLIGVPHVSALSSVRVGLAAAPDMI
jgi:hypothetical protein